MERSKENGNSEGLTLQRDLLFHPPALLSKQHSESSPVLSSMILMTNPSSVRGADTGRTKSQAGGTALVGDLTSGRAFDSGCCCYSKSEAVINDLRGVETICQCDVSLLVST